MKNNILFDDVYNQNKDSVLRMCLLYLKDYQLAEDAAQETFMRVYKNLNKYKGKSNLKTWITAIAINVCKSKMMKKSYSEQVFENDRIFEREDSEINIDNKILVTEAISNLPAELKEVVILFYYQELTQKEISQILGISQPLVAYRIRQSKKALRNFIKEDNYE